MFQEDDTPNGGHLRRAKERGNWSINLCTRSLKDSKGGQCDAKRCDQCLRYDMFREKK